MQYLLRILRNKTVTTTLLILFALFIIFDISPPLVVSQNVDTLVGRLFVLFTVILLLFANPIIGILAAVSALELFRRSEYKKHIQFVPSEKKKFKKLQSINQFPKTLEEEVVQTMLPTANPGTFPPPSFRPYPEKIHGAARV